MSDSVQQHHASRSRSAVTVLLAEDDLHMRMLLRGALEDEGYQVVVARDGAEALSVLRWTRPCVVLLDLDSPEIRGEQVAAKLRATHGSAAPVIVVSGAADGPIRAHRAGADRYLGKPVDVDTLVAYVAEAVGVDFA